MSVTDHLEAIRETEKKGMDIIETARAEAGRVVEDAGIEAKNKITGAHREIEEERELRLKRLQDEWAGEVTMLKEKEAKKKEELIGTARGRIKEAVSLVIDRVRG